jgi:hypothetical protein
MTRVPRRPGIFLKARPTASQLANRLAPPVPDGVELYIHEDDVSAPDWLDTLRVRFAQVSPPDGFTWVVEGPVWSLDGQLFGLCRNDETDRELVRRLLALCGVLRAPALNIHCVEGSPDAGVLSEARRRETLDRALPFLEWYVARCRDAGVQPLIENVPPICRMRRSAFIYTPIGVEPRDLLSCVQAVPGLKLTLDTSHAQLAVNAFRGIREPAEPAAAGGTNGANGEDGGDLDAAGAFYRDVAGPQTLAAYVAPLLPWVHGVHVSNAAGLLAEGLPYERGDADLDAVAATLASTAAYFVTEPLDADEDTAPLKRQMQARLESVLARTGDGGGDPGRDEGRRTKDEAASVLGPSSVPNGWRPTPRPTNDAGRV